MIETKIRKVGNSTVLTLSTDALAILDAKAGDRVFLVRGDAGDLRVLTHDPSVTEALEAADIVADENRDLLAALV